MSRIALFDTEYSTLRSLYYALTGEGHEVITNTATETIEGQPVTQLITDPVHLLNKILQPQIIDGHATVKAPDLFIIDFLNIDGEKIMKLLKQIRLTKDIPIIAMSHVSGNIDRLQMIEIYGAHYISKPFNIWEVVECAESFIGIKC